jgi:hypothetical protein
MYLNPANGSAVVAVFNTDTDLKPGTGPAGNGPSAFNIIREAAFKLIE